MNMSSFAKNINITRAAVSNWNKLGQIVFFDGSKIVDVDKTMARLKAVGKRFDKDGKYIPPRQNFKPKKEVCTLDLESAGEIKVNPNFKPLSDEEVQERGKDLAIVELNTKLEKAKIINAEILEEKKKLESTIDIEILKSRTLFIAGTKIKEKYLREVKLYLYIEQQKHELDVISSLVKTRFLELCKIGELEESSEFEISKILENKILDILNQVKKEVNFLDFEDKTSQFMKEKVLELGVDVANSHISEVDSIPIDSIFEYKLFWQTHYDFFTFLKDQGDMLLTREVEDEVFKIVRSVRDGFSSLSNLSSQISRRGSISVEVIIKQELNGLFRDNFFNNAELTSISFGNRVESVCAKTSSLALTPNPSMDIAEYSNTYRYLSSEGAAEHGRYDINKLPYLVEIAKWLSPSNPTQEVAVCKGVQLGFTELGNNAIFTYADLYPRPIMGMLPTQTLLKTHVKRKVWTGVNASPRIKEVFNPIQQGRIDASSTLEMIFRGGFCKWLWSESTSSYASGTYGFVLASDIDRYPDDVGGEENGEGDPISLLRKRLITFGSARKFFLESSPTKKRNSKIWKEAKNGDANRFFMHCPDCNEMITFLKDDFIYEYDKKSYKLIGDVHFCCKHCGSLIHDHQKNEMMKIENGAKYMPTNSKNDNPFKKTVFIGSYYSPWMTFNEIFQDYLDAMKEKEQEGSSKKLKVWYNTVDGTVYQDDAEMGIDIEVSELLERREDYTKLPNETVLLTAGVDTQHNRFEITVLAWLNKRVKYVVAQYVVGGDPKSKETQALLDKLLFEQTWELEDGKKMKIFASSLDTGGDRTDAMYDYCRMRPKKNLYSIKGGNSLTDPLVKNFTMTKTKRNRDVRLFVLGVNSGKDDIIEDLRENSTRYYHFPRNIKKYTEESPMVIKNDKELEMTDEEYFTQLVTEKLDANGRWRNGNKNKNEPKRANEAIDCMVYANSALGIYNLVHGRIRRKRLDLDVMAEKGEKRGLVESVATPKRRRRIYSKGI